MVLSLTIGAAVTAVLISFGAEYIDSSLGMGYGTSLTPILLLLGYEPLQIVPAILVSELISGILAGLIHNKAGNVDFSIRKCPLIDFLSGLRKDGLLNSFRGLLSRDLKIVIVIALFSIAGTILSVNLALSLSGFVLKIYIGILVTVIGLVILITLSRTFAFSWKKIISLSVIASFNKGISGGGYGPVVTGGQLLSGVNDKTAIGITSLAEGLTCAAGLAAYFLLSDGIDLSLFPFLAAGAVISVPFSVHTVKKIHTGRLRLIIGICTIALGIFTLIKIVL